MNKNLFSRIMSLFIFPLVWGSASIVLAMEGQTPELVNLSPEEEAFEQAFYEEIKKNPHPPHEGIKGKDLTVEQRKDIKKYWDDLNTRINDRVFKATTKIEQLPPQTEQEKKKVREDVRALGVRTFSYDTPFPNNVPVPLNEVDEQRLAWSMEAAGEVKEYFLQPYLHNPEDKLRCPGDQVVYRPNHSLPHGLRQAFLAVDIAVFLKHAKDSDLSPRGKELCKWIIQKIKSDAKFLQKLEFANAFQRSGRQSEIGRKDNAERYDEYLLNDQKNFEEAAQRRLGDLFANQEEIDIFKEAITKKFGSSESSSDLLFLSKIFYTAHQLDLRRLGRFDKDEILQTVAAQLFETQVPNDAEQNLIDRLWQRSGEYLKATGDRDMEDPQRKGFDSYDLDVFCKQAKNPELLVRALHRARMKSEQTLLQSIDAHVQSIRKIKETQSSISEPEDKEKSILEKAAYTASEAYLKILLDVNYKEIPANAAEEEARKIIRENIEAFLKEPKRKVDNAFVARIESPDEHYIETLVNCMMEERRHRDKIVFYHATEAETGFWYDVFTQLRNQLMMEGGDNIRALRVIDEEFLKLDAYAQEEGSLSMANVATFMKKYKGVADSNTAYRDMVLSTNFSLFGSDQQIWADTYYMFYMVNMLYSGKEERISTQQLKYDTFCSFIEQRTGIHMPYETYKKILDRFVLRCGGMPCKNGRLIQIFVDPKALNDVAYFSVLLGAPALKEGKTPPLDEPITLLRTDPTEFLKYLSNTKGSDVSGVGSNLLRPNTLVLHDLQARVFLRPEIMFDPELATVKSYWRFGPPQEEKAYYDEIKKIVSKSLVSWLQEGAPAEEGSLAPQTVKLKNFMQQVYKGSTGSDAPNAPPVTIEDRFLKLIKDEKWKEAAIMLEENYDELSTKKFIQKPDRYGHGGGEYTLFDILKDNHTKESMPLFKIAFGKGLFKGGEAAYQIALSIHYYLDQVRFIESLNNLKDPSETCSLVVKYFNLEEINSMSQLIEVIDHAGNNESILTTAQPLIDALKKITITHIINAVANLPDEKRQSVIQETIERVTNVNEGKRFWEAGIAHNIERLLPLVLDMQSLDSSQRDYLWSLAKKMENEDWYWRIKTMEVMKNIKWVPDKRSPKGPIFYQYSISAPFNAMSVVRHAGTYPEIYDMDFLKSPPGEFILNEIIHQLNQGMVPEDDFEALSIAYNRGSPDAGYNKSLIGHYVSRLKYKAAHKKNMD